MNLNTAGWASAAQRFIARLRSDGLNSTTPVTEINGGTISAVNADIALVAKGTGATLAQVPDGTVAGGDKRGIYATDLQKTRTTNAGRIASGEASTIGGGNNNGASGQYSVVAGGNGNTAVGGQSCIAGGTTNGANGTASTICGGNTNTASGSSAFVGGGTTNSSSGIASVICGGTDNIANGNRSVIVGGVRGTTRSIDGYMVFPAHNGAINATSTGISQSALLLLARETTTNTATVLTSNSSAASTTNQVILPNNAAYYFRGSVIAGVTGAGDTKAWTFEGAIKRGATAASTAIVGSVVLNVIAADAGASAWTVAITADTTNGGIAVTVTGAAATTIRWVAKIETTEMTY